MFTLRAAVLQMEHAAGDKAANFAKVEAFVRQAAEQGVKLLVCPECCLTGYWFLRKLTRAQLLELAEPVPEGPSTQRLLALARQYQLTIGAGLIERERSGSSTRTSSRCPMAAGCGIGSCKRLSTNPFPPARSSPSLTCRRACGRGF